MPKAKTDKKQKNLFLTEVARTLLEKLSIHQGVGESDVVEILIRDKAKKEGIKP